MTFSLVARCSETGMFGVAVSSSSPAVGARCPYSRSGIGAVSTQNITDPRLGPLALDLLSTGKDAEFVGNSLCKHQENMEYRQLLIIDANGKTFIHSGSNTLGIYGSASSTDVAAAGNLLSHDSVPDAMVDSFVNSSGHLAERLLLSLESGLHSGGEASSVHSASLQVVDKVSWPIVDLRIDWSDDCPISSLRSLWLRYSPQVEDYICRGLDPGLSPSYGVAGDE